MMYSSEGIDEFLQAEGYAVAGASADSSKFGFKCYQALLKRGMVVYPVNPHLSSLEGNTCYPDLRSLPAPVQSVSVITQPAVTERIVDDAIKAGLKCIWMQPGAESAYAVLKASEAGLTVISGGPCLLVTLGYVS